MATPSLFLPSPVGDRAAFTLHWCFNEGVKEGINKLWRFTDGTSLGANVNLLNIYDCVRVTNTTSAQGVYTYAGSDYEQSLIDGDATPSFMNPIYEQTVPNGKPRRREVRIDRNHWTDDNIGRYQTEFHALGTAAVVAPYRALVNTIRYGKFGGKSTGATLTSGIDNVAYYGTHYSRPGDTTSTAQPNTLVMPGGLTRANMATAWSTMVGWRGEDGEVMGQVPSVLAVGPQDLDAALDIATMERPSGAAGGGSTFRGRVEVCFVPEWGESTPGANDGIWALFDTNSSMERAWVFQEREPNKIMPIATNPMDPQVVMQDYLNWLLQGRWEIGMGHYRRMIRVTRS